MIKVKKLLLCIVVLCLCFVLSGCARAETQACECGRILEGIYFLNGTDLLSFVEITENTVEFTNVDFTEYIENILIAFEYISVLTETGEYVDIVFSMADESEVEMAHSLFDNMFEGQISFICDEFGEYTYIVLSTGESDVMFLMQYDVVSNTIKIGSQFFILVTE